MPSSPRFTAVIFDLDGTLVDSVPDIAFALNGALAELRLPTYEEHVVRHWVGNGSEVLVLRALQQSDAPESLHKEAHACFLKHYGQSLSHGSCLYSGVKETLDAMQSKQVRMAIVTNKPIAFVPALLSELGIEHYFEVILGGDSLPVKKPDPTPLFYVCKKMNLKTSETLMVGDSKNDILAAQAANMQVVGLTYGYNYGEDIALSQPDFVFDQFQQVLSVL